MAHTIRKISILLIVAALVMLMPACKKGEGEVPTSKPKSIVILYENDAHCQISGYSKLCGLKEAILSADTSYVAVVSAGDFLQGALPGAYSHGEFIVQLMNRVGYDAVTIGNHEFDYGMERALELLPRLHTSVVCANLFAKDAPKPIFSPYVIKRYGDKRIAFVGVTTPDAMQSEAYAFFDENQHQVYDLRTEEVYSLVQEAVDNARAEGADYVIVLSHMGEAKLKTGVTSHAMIAATRGIDVVLDGHTHSVIPYDSVANLDGQLVPITQTGTQFAYYGHLWISTDGRMQLDLIPDADNPYRNPSVSALEDSINRVLDDATYYPVAQVAFDLPVKDENAMWYTRREETPIGNLIADAYRLQTGADIGLVNGGSVRNGLKAGIVTYGDVYSVLPFDNIVCRILATGTQVMDMLTRCTAKCPEQDGSFPQVSGIRFTIHTASHRVSDVSVYDALSDTYLPLDPEGLYTIATTDYYASGGFYCTLQECPILDATGMMGRDILTDYLEITLQGIIPETYRSSQGRITISQD